MGLFARVVAAAVALRAALLLYGSWQDSTLAVKYTDVDYTVFTDAARKVLEGGSAFDRHTYRYTPVLAFLMIPSILVHEAWGKLLFCACDVAAGIVIRRILAHRGASPRDAALGAALWLLNPIVANVSTRGNADALVVLPVLALLLCAQRGHWAAAGCFLGAGAHLKLFPVVYAIPIALQNAAANHAQRRSAGADRGSRCCAGLRALFCVPNVAAGAGAALTFAALTAFCYAVDGRRFLDEAVLYHALRRDHRHNFSPFFYPLYLRSALGRGDGGGVARAVEALAGFVPQVAGLAALGAALHRDLAAACLAQTWAFVMLNKVCTVQYFVWYFALVAIALPPRAAALRRVAAPTLAWAAAMIHWLEWAYLLEFQGWNTFRMLWVASLLFLGANVWLLRALLREQGVSRERGRAKAE